MAFWGRKDNQGPGGDGEAMTPQDAEQAAQAAHEPAAAFDAGAEAPAEMAAAAGDSGGAGQLDKQELERRAAASKRLLMSFGEIVSVMMRSPQFKTATLADVEQLVVPAVSTGQFLVAEAQSKETGFITPVSVALWATVSDEVDQRLASNPDAPIKLAAEEWRSGANPWLIALVGDRRPMNALLRRLHETTFKDRPLRVRTRGEDGGYHIKAFTTAGEG